MGGRWEQVIVIRTEDDKVVNNLFLFRSLALVQTKLLLRASEVSCLGFVFRNGKCKLLGFH